MMSKIAALLLSFIKYWLVIWRAKPVNSLVFLFTEGRGGGTWLMEIISETRGDITIFEPWDGGSYFSDRLFPNNPFPFDHCGDSIAIGKAFRNIQDYNGVKRKNVMFNTFKRIIDNNGATVKFVNKTLVLHDDGLKSYLKLHKSIVLVRNPVEIIVSRAKYGYLDFKKETVVNFNSWFNLCDTHILTENKEFLQSLSTNYEYYIAEWCITYGPFIRNEYKDDSVYVVFYKDLLTKTNKIIDQIFTYLGIDYNPSEIDFNKNSASTKRLIVKHIDHEFLPNHDERFERIYNYYGLSEYIAEL